MTLDYGKQFSTKATRQSQQLPGSTQILNSADGYSWPVDEWTRLDRFLILGTEGGSYYARQRELTVENANAIRRLIEANGPRVVTRVVEVSSGGRAPKNDPAIFVLAMCAKLGDEQTRRLAYNALPTVCRIGTHLFHFASYAEAFGGWGRGMRTAVARWYNKRDADRLAYQVVKYQARDGWSNRDLLRLAHPKATTPAHQQIYRWITQGKYDAGADQALAMIDAFERAKAAEAVREIVDLIETCGLPREAIPTQWLSRVEVWQALLQRMPMTAMIRNLATMTRIGLLRMGSDATNTVVERLQDSDRLRKARIHPIAVLAALMTYQSGHGARGKHTWNPIGQIVDALNEAFYATFANVEPTNKRMLLALDVSGSMTGGMVAGVPGLTPRVASAAMALITAATEKQYGFVAFTGGDYYGTKTKPKLAVSALDISPRQRLDDVLARVSGLPFGATDCALPMLWALAKKVAVDTFVIYTDSETWCGRVHPVQALQRYRRETGIAAKLVVVGMVANNFTIADPDDAGMLDVVGFDTAAPAVISDFCKQ